MKTSRLPLRLLGSLFILLLSCSFTQPSLTQKQVLSDLDVIRHVFEVKYAPKDWKEEFSGWNLDQAIEEAKNKVMSLSSPTTKECQVIVRDFFNSTRDYHVGVRFFSTESASLPFLVKGSEGRYFISYVDRDQVSSSKFPFEEGDEILTFGGRPVHDVIQEIRVKEFGLNTLETDQALAELALTHRLGNMGHDIPQGKVRIVGVKQGTTREKRVTLQWAYVSERIRDFSKLGVNVDCSTQFRSDQKPDLKTNPLFDKMMTPHFWNQSYVGASTTINKHMIGARSSFIPELGAKVWESGSNAIFDAYIFLDQDNRKIGYIRIPHYSGCEEEVEEFGEIMNFFERYTDALVIDQVNNPGGDVFYLYALVSTLADKPFHAPKHRIAMTQEEVFTAHMILSYLEDVTNDESAREIFGENVSGYPVDYHFIKTIRKFCHFLVDQWNRGSTYTDPTFLFGADQIQPHPDYHYSKPALLLINSLCFSGGDFLPAILQDNGRVTVMGTRTAGAGGYVTLTHFPNHTGMQGFLMTGSHAKRIDQQPIENLGVTPEIVCDLTPVDLQEDYQEYRTKILEAVDSLL